MASEELTARYAGYARPSALASADWLQGLLDDPDVKVVEVDVNPKSYNTWHIEGAVLWDVYKDLKTPITGRLTASPSSGSSFGRA